MLYCSIALLFDAPTRHYYSLTSMDMPERIEIILNGEEMRISTEWRVNDLVEDLELVGRQVAVELNGQIVRRDRWQEEALASGDRVEIVHFVGGGEN